MSPSAQGADDRCVLPGIGRAEGGREVGGCQPILHLPIVLNCLCELLGDDIISHQHFLFFALVLIELRVLVRERAL